MWFFLPLLAVSLAQSNFYTASSIIYSNSSVSAILTYQGAQNSSIISPLNLTVLCESFNYARIRITDLKNPRWEVPDIAVPVSSLLPLSEANYTVAVNASPFGLSITRKTNGQVVFNIDPSQIFQYQNQDIILTSSLNYSFYVYGIGERITNFPLFPGTYTLFAKGLPGPYDDGKPPGKNGYGSHPVYVGLDSQGNAHGGFLMNSDAMDVTVAASSITFRVIGGIIDYYVFIGPTPNAVLQQYHSVIGHPYPVPYWSLGYHQCRWGYHNLSDLESVVENFNRYHLPLDVLWTDIDYMIEFEDFTLDPTRYPYAEFQKFINSLHAAGRRFVPITDAGIAQIDYPPYTIGLEQNVFIQSAFHPGPAVGSVWPGNASFVDWFNPNATEYWHSMMDALRTVMQFDGFWVDMNEISSFCVGECGYPQSALVQNLPYMPGQITLDNFTIDLASTHYGGLLEFDLHNLYGLKMAHASSLYFSEKLSTRPFILSRSTFPSHGRFASHWLGDNYAEYSWMGYSLPGVFNFQIFGIPLVGADLCGFMGNTTEELCCRWYQMGMLYPFTRNHNSNDTIPQEPWAFGPTLLRVANNAIRIKYSLMNFYYSWMFRLALEGGGFFVPTFFHFPADANLQFTHSQDQFMLGEELIVHPVLAPGVSSVRAYFPVELWYNWYSGVRVITPFNRTVTLSAPMDGVVNIHIRGGRIVTKNDGFENANTVEELRYANISLVVAINGNGYASGFLILDDGISVGTIEAGNFTGVNYFYAENDTGAALKINLWHKGYQKKTGEWPFISTLHFYGMLQRIQSIYNGAERVDYQTSYNQGTQVAMAKIRNIEPDVDCTLTINF
jgi:alpha-glucosidase (family GH31 glycosyl hydrolase)